MATPHTMTLLDVVEAVSECTTSEEKDVATVADLINSFGALSCTQREVSRPMFSHQELSL